jgi:hypothetical protein
VRIVFVTPAGLWGCFNCISGGWAGSWRRLHNEGLRYFYDSAYIIRMGKSRKMRWAGHVARMGTMRIIPEGKRPLGTPRRRWEDNIRTDLTEIGWVCIERIVLLDIIHRLVSQEQTTLRN